MKFDPEAYSITIRKEEIDDEILYVGRVAEFPNISVYEEDFVTARNLVIDAIQALKKLLTKRTKIFRRHISQHPTNFWNGHPHFDK
jgi:hypothetical protein